MTKLWIELPERPRYEGEEVFVYPLQYVLTRNDSPYHEIQSGSAYIDELPLAENVTLIAPARDVFIIEKTVDIFSSLNEQRLVQALPGLLEDEVMYFDKNHVALWRDSNNLAHLAFAFIDKAWIRQIVDIFSNTFKKIPLCIIPASYFQEIGTLVTVSDKQRDQLSGWACYRKSLHEAYLVPLQDNPLLTLHHVELNQLVHNRLQDRIAFLQTPYIDLRQFEFADHNVGWRAQWQRWKSSVLVLLLAVIIQTVAVNVYWLTLAFQKHRLINEERSVAQQIIPQLPDDVDPQLALRHQWQLANQLAPTSDKDFVVLCAKLSQIMVHQPNDAVTKIDFHQGTMNVSLKPGVNIDMVKQDALNHHVTINNIGGGVWQIK
ncbi:MAG: hypothetical protein KGN31_06470 [Betaproteobacteria bacterium]|nr:hypothetical protein [Betaproteobacteria bacterium]